MSKNKISWFLEKSYLWGRGIASISNKDIVMAFYPKTGSTYTRIFLFNLLSGNSSDEVFTFDEVNKVMPEIGNHSFFNKWPFENCPKLIKTHRPYKSFYKKNKKILFARDPRDVMVSFLHYANAKKVFNFSGNLKDLVYHPEMGLEYYMKFYSSWISRADLIIKYEDLRKTPMESLTKVVNFIGLDYSEEEIAVALEASSLDKTRVAQKSSSDNFKGIFKKGFVFARKGESGEGQNEFDNELNDYYKELRRKYSFDLYHF